MLQFLLTDGNNEMTIDYQSGSVGFTVVLSDGSQVDFSIEDEDWEPFKNFIEAKMKQDDK